jgi:hypothetical protein
LHGFTGVQATALGDIAFGPGTRSHESSWEMKSEKRHELETNYLANWLGRTYKRTEPYHRTIGWAVTAGLVAVAAFVIVSKFLHGGSASAWDQFYTAIGTSNSAELEQIAEDHPGTPVALLGRSISADSRLAEACMQVFTDKASAAQELRKAIDDYTVVINQTREPQLRQRALFGRARAYETLSGTPQGTGELSKAIDDYERLVELAPNGTYSAMANDQLKRLKSQDIKVFYDKFAAYSPKRPVSKEPGPDGKQLPFDSNALPDSEGQSEFSKLLNLNDLKVKGAKSTTPEKKEPGKAEPAKTEASKNEPPKATAPKIESKTADSPKGNAPAAPPAASPKSEPPKK